MPEPARAEAFLTHLAPHSEALLSYARRALTCPGDVEDAVQAGVLLALRDFGRFVEGTSFRAFVFTCNVGHARGRDTTCRSCLTAIQGDGWCEGCRVGYAGGRRTTCRGCFDLMRSAQGGWCASCNVGHARGLDTSCRSCLTAIQEGGACDGCGVRFGTVAFKRYVARVAGLARAETRDAVEHALAHVGATALQVDAAQGTVRFELDRAREPELTRALAALRERGVDAALGR